MLTKAFVLHVVMRMSYEEEDTCPGCLRTRGLTKLTKAFLLHVVMRLYHMYHMLHVVQRLYLYATCSKGK